MQLPQQVCRRDEPSLTSIALGPCEDSWPQPGHQNPPSTGHVGSSLQALSSSTFGRKVGTSFINFKMLPLLQAIDNWSTARSSSVHLWETCKTSESPGHLHRVSNVSIGKNSDAYRTQMYILTNTLCNYILCLFFIRVMLYLLHSCW